MVNSRVALLSDNAVLLLEEAFKNQRLLRLVHYTFRDPFSTARADVLKTDVFNFDQNVFKITPLPFSGDVPEDQSCQLRIHFPVGTLSADGAIAQTQVYFQFVYHNELALINDGGKPKIRYYEMINEIVKTYHGRSIGTLGKINFGQGRPPFNNASFRFVGTGNTSYGMYELSANMMTVK